MTKHPIINITPTSTEPAMSNFLIFKDYSFLAKTLPTPMIPPSAKKVQPDYSPIINPYYLVASKHTEDGQF
jgi:hypothetical protein